MGGIGKASTNKTRGTGTRSVQSKQPAAQALSGFVNDFSIRRGLTSAWEAEEYSRRQQELDKSRIGAVR